MLLQVPIVEGSRTLRADQCKRNAMEGRVTYRAVGGEVLHSLRPAEASGEGASRMGGGRKETPGREEDHRKASTLKRCYCEMSGGLWVREPQRAIAAWGLITRLCLING